MNISIIQPNTLLPLSAFRGFGSSPSAMKNGTGHLSAVWPSTTLSNTSDFLLPAQYLKDEGKLTVVLDVDETLIHAEFLPAQVQMSKEMMEMFNERYGSQMFCFQYDGRIVVVRKRPHLEEFLRELGKQCEVIAFTAGQEEYASQVLDRLDPNHTIFRHRLFRQHCAFNGLVKDLRVLNRNLERTVLVDNSHTSFLLQMSNGIPIESFVDDMSDQALLTLSKFLAGLKNEFDVRTSLRNIFKLETKMTGFEYSNYGTKRH